MPELIKLKHEATGVELELTLEQAMKLFHSSMVVAEERAKRAESRLAQLKCAESRLAQLENFNKLVEAAGDLVGTRFGTPDPPWPEWTKFCEVYSAVRTELAKALSTVQF